MNNVGEITSDPDEQGGGAGQAGYMEEEEEEGRSQVRAPRAHNLAPSL